MELYLQKFIREHENWEELLSADPYNIKVSRDNGYILFKYNQIASDFNLPEVREARGIIFRETDLECVCHPFDKFGNYGESYCPEIDWSTASVQEKIDGSLMKVWYDTGWHISTNGTIDAAKANTGGLENKTFRDIFNEALPFSFDTFIKLLHKGYCYMFELVSPLTRVVIEYPKAKLYLLGVRDMTTHQEYNPEGFSLLRNHFDIPKRYELHSLADVKNAANALPWDEEGYVVCDKQYNRVKIKSPEYVKAHYARNNSMITWERLLNVLLSGEIAEFCIYASEYTDKLHMLDREMRQFMTDIRTAVEALKPESFTSRKDYALEVKKFPQYMQSFLFRYEKLDEAFTDLNTSKWEYILRERGVI